MNPIPHTLIRSNRKSISIQITAQGVVVRAPRAATDSQVEHYVQSKRSWIESHLAKLPEPQPKFTRAEVEELVRKALAVIPERVRHYAPIVGVRYGNITIRNQRSRWGSCSSKGNLNFNCLLMLTPAHVIDYVVVHELCHRLELNHSPRFWSHLERVLPNYRQSAQWLKEHEKELIWRL